MPIDAPNGFLTRPEAAKTYNRSQRALERDLDKAITSQDQDQLIHWKLITKEGQVRDGGDVDIGFVKQLVIDGMTPAWCVAEAYLSEHYGRRGSPKPQERKREVSNEFPEQAAESVQHKAANEQDADSLPHAVSFLRERIRTLEREKQQEIERHDKYVAQLFAQLEVKDKQISAWDEITQAMTKGLATGQLLPRLQTGRSARAPSNDTVPVNADQAAASDMIEVTAPAKKQKKGNAVSRKGSHTGSKVTVKKHAKRQPSKRKPTPKPKWHEMPTLSRLLRIGK
jgi:hypothetical protein